MKNIALELAKTADTILNGLIILVLVYFAIIVISMSIREFSESRKRKPKTERIKRANVHR